MKRLLVVGSGAGGTLTANLLAKSLKGKIHRGEVSVDLIGESAQHVFQPGFLDVAFKGHPPSGLMRPEAGLVVKDVTFRNEAAVKIDLEERAVTLASGTKLGYDYLVMATGGVRRQRDPAGLKEASFNFHTGPEDRRGHGRRCRNSRAGRLWWP